MYADGVRNNLRDERDKAYKDFLSSSVISVPAEKSFSDFFLFHFYWFPPFPNSTAQISMLRPFSALEYLQALHRMLFLFGMSQQLDTTNGVQLQSHWPHSFFAPWSILNPRTLASLINYSRHRVKHYHFLFSYKLLPLGSATSFLYYESCSTESVPRHILHYPLFLVISFSALPWHRQKSNQDVCTLNQQLSARNRKVKQHHTYMVRKHCLLFGDVALLSNNTYTHFTK